MYAVTVLFPVFKATLWSSVESKYKEKKKLFIAEYGQPEEDDELPDENDISKLGSFLSDKYKYNSFFATEDGVIVMGVAHFEGFMFSVTVCYVDRINGLD